MLSEGSMRRASLRDRAFDPWPRAAQPWTTQDADAKSPGKRSASLHRYYLDKPIKVSTLSDPLRADPRAKRALGRAAYATTGSL